MSGMLIIPLYREASYHHEPELKKGDCRSGCYRTRRAVPLSIGALREEFSSFWMDPQYAAHAAHAFDPSGLDARPVIRRGRALGRDDSDSSLRSE